METLAQILGLIVTFFAVAAMQLKKKRQILAFCFIANALNILMYFIIDGFSSAMAVSIIAASQCAINCFLAFKNKDAGVLQKIIFTVLFLGSGLMQFKGWLDILPLAGALTFMLSVFQTKEQNMRIFSLLNCCCWLVYNCIIGSTALFAQLISLISISVALYRFRKK